MDLCQWAELLWKLYLTGTEESAVRMLEAMDDNIVIIGTGGHEFYEVKDAFVQSYQMEDAERQEIEFQIRSLWSKEIKLSDDASLVYGGLYVTGSSKGKEVVVDMDSRYSMVFSRISGKWKLVHIHQSLPYKDQQEGEYYPKTLTDQLEEEKRRTKKMEALARMDQMTKALNHEAFFQESGWLLQAKGTGYCFVVDLDDFKKINDLYGHQEGDAVLQEISKILRRAVYQRGIAGRIGGDEFAIFCGDLDSKESACRLAQDILEQVRQRSQRQETAFPGVSIGISQVRKEESLKKAFQRADAALYVVKRSGKNDYCFDD